jgi:hypothetical protein
MKELLQIQIPKNKSVGIFVLVRVTKLVPSVTKCVCFVYSVRQHVYVLFDIKNVRYIQQTCCLFRIVFFTINILG